MVFDALHFYYGSTTILRGAFLKISSGSICGLVGRNGSGKSTLMKIGIGELTPFSGNIFIDGDCVTFHKGAKRFKHIAYLSQNSFVPHEIAVGTLLQICKADVSLKNDEILEPLLPQKTRELSSGERRYLELCLVLSLKRKYYLLDEPFTGAAPVLIEKMSALIQEKKKNGAGILLTDHYSRYVKKVVDEIYLIEDGYCTKQKSPG